MNWIHKLTLGVLLAVPGTEAMAREPDNGLEKWEWYVRLIVSAQDGALEDRGNVLGQLNDAELEADPYDLRELAPFAAPFLSVVFHHPEWGLEVVDYTSDYHPLTRNQADEWTFEVRSDDPGRDITLSWEGTAADLERMALVDLLTDTVIPASLDGELQTYSFNMGGHPVRPMQWVFSKKGGGSGKRSAPQTQTTSAFQVSDWPPPGWPFAEGGPAGERLPPDPLGN